MDLRYDRVSIDVKCPCRCLRDQPHTDRVIVDGQVMALHKLVCVTCGFVYLMTLPTDALVGERGLVWVA